MFILPFRTADANKYIFSPADAEPARAVASHKSLKTTVIYTARDLALAVEVARKIG